MLVAPDYAGGIYSFFIRKRGGWESYPHFRGIIYYMVVGNDQPRRVDDESAAGCIVFPRLIGNIVPLIASGKKQADFIVLEYEFHNFVPVDCHYARFDCAECGIVPLCLEYVRIAGRKEFSFPVSLFPDTTVAFCPAQVNEVVSAGRVGDEGEFVLPAYMYVFVDTLVVVYHIPKAFQFVLRFGETRFQRLVSMSGLPYVGLIGAV